MKIALGNGRQLALWGGLAVILVSALVYLDKPHSTTLPGIVSRQTTLRPYRRVVEDSKPEDVRSLTPADFEALSHAGNLEGPNIFGGLIQRSQTSFVPVAPPIVAHPPAHAAPTLASAPQRPEVTFRLLGTFGPKEEPIAALTLGGQLSLAHEGDIVFGRFRLVKIGHESVEVQSGEGDLGETRRIGLQP